MAVREDWTFADFVNKFREVQAYRNQPSGQSLLPNLAASTEAWSKVDADKFMDEMRGRESFTREQMEACWNASVAYTFFNQNPDFKTFINSLTNK